MCANPPRVDASSPTIAGHDGGGAILLADAPSIYRSSYLITIRVVFESVLQTSSDQLHLPISEAAGHLVGGGTNHPPPFAFLTTPKQTQNGDSPLPLKSDASARANYVFPPPPPHPSAQPLHACISCLPLRVKDTCQKTRSQRTIQAQRQAVYKVRAALERSGVC